MLEKKTISLILPCRDEEEGVGFCLTEIKQVISVLPFEIEVLVVDNNSVDRSAAIVAEHQKNFPNLRLLTENRDGYGFAYLKGLSEIKGDYIFLADADGSYDFSELPKFIKFLEDGADLVVGNRFANKLSRQEMPWTHYYLGNPFLSALVKIFFKVKLTDIHCGARALKSSIIKSLDLRTGGMEFASEMIIKAARNNLKIAELPIKYRPRLGQSKLNSFRDGWRHLRFILIYSPFLLFFLPGLLILLSGIMGGIVFYFNNPSVLGIQFYFHPLFLFSLLTILGYQLIIFGGFSKVYAVTHLGDAHRLIEGLFQKITIERAGLLGLIIVIIGLSVYFSIFSSWLNSGLGELSREKDAIVGLSLAIIGIQTIFSAFMFSILGIKNK